MENNENKNVEKVEEDIKKDELVAVDENIDIEKEVSGEESSAEEMEETIVTSKPIDDSDPDEIRLNEIELKLQEYEIKIDEFEFKHAGFENMTDEEFAEYENMKQEYKNLFKERKDIRKRKKSKSSDSDIEQSSLWIFLYGIAMSIFSFPLVCYTIYFKFGSWIINSFIKGSIDTSGFFYKLLIWLIVFSLPILLIALSWLLFGTIVKKKIDKKIFSIFWIIQGVFTLGTIIWLTIALNIFG